MSDIDQIKSCIDLYYEGCCESDSSKIKKAFDKNAMISGYLPDGLHEMNLDEFAGFVDAQQPSPKEKGDKPFLEILSCEILGETALVKIKEQYLGMIFIDSFSFLRKDDTWRIYTKLFHVES